MDAGDRSTANYLLNNTGSREYHTSAVIGYDRGRLRVEGFYSRFHNLTGVMLSAQMGSEDLLAERIRLGRPLHTDPFSRSIRAPSQTVTHQTAVGKVRFNMKHGEAFTGKAPGRRTTGKRTVSGGQAPTSRQFPCT